ncbi:MAG: TetR/AcrR family transcriptional regulator [Coleofasciculaceae cyanobacterium SM2_1_6]|nr:TetR/AcrR family transcriptional regulator [Coleofasciculaceae cyanobacterium SM2_1_6]
MPKIVDHDQYRKELLAKSFNLFAEKGYAAITMRQVAQGIGVSTGTLYHYFPSKEVLFEQLIEQSCQESILTVQSRMKNTQTLRERLALVAEYIEEQEEKLIRQTQLWIDFCQHHAVNPKDLSLWQRMNHRHEQAAAEMLEITNPEIVKLLGCVIDGVLLGRMLGSREISFTKQLGLFGEILAASSEKN